jgi:hypothetical protein
MNHQIIYDRAFTVVISCRSSSVYLKEERSLEVYTGEENCVNFLLQLL